MMMALLIEFSKAEDDKCDKKEDGKISTREKDRRKAHQMLDKTVAAFHILETKLTNEQFVQTKREKTPDITNRLKTIQSTN